jgi:hypothetical protein
LTQLSSDGAGLSSTRTSRRRQLLSPPPGAPKQGLQYGAAVAARLDNDRAVAADAARTGAIALIDAAIEAKAQTTAR